MSSISIYETIVAVEKGRIPSSIAPEALVRRWLASGDIVRIPFGEEIAIRSRTLEFRHEDPFDRIIATTAVQEKAPLMTADRNLLNLDWLPTIPAQ
jgi:PIN domain nuclease of toxin-antitoxin system